MKTDPSNYQENRRIFQELNTVCQDFFFEFFFKNFSLKKLTSGSQESFKRISVLSDILHFEVSKFLVSVL